MGAGAAAGKQHLLKKRGHLEYPRLDEEEMGEDAAVEKPPLLKK